MFIYINKIQDMDTSSKKNYRWIIDLSDELPNNATLKNVACGELKEVNERN